MSKPYPNLAGRVQRVMVLAALSATRTLAECQREWLPGDSAPGVAGTVYAFARWDPDGPGPSPALLAVGGSFYGAGATYAKNVAIWNGESWSMLGTGANGTVRALAAYDDGTGSALYAAGEFTEVGGIEADHIAKWDGFQWAPVAGGLNGAVNALSIYDDGEGAGLYAVGQFTSAGSNTANHIARWNGMEWSALSSGLNSAAAALIVLDEGSGPQLIVSGGFSIEGGVTARGFARWNGKTWTAVGTGPGGGAGTLCVHDDGSGSALYANGAFGTVRKWDGQTWSYVGTGMGGQYGAGTVRSLASFDGGTGPTLYAVGTFITAGGNAARNIAKWDGSTWSAVGSGLSWDAHALLAFDGAGGKALMAGGSFRRAGAIGVNSVAQWDGTSWIQLGGGTNAWITALTVFDDGLGPALYAGGDFTLAGGVSASRVAKWDGVAWSALDSGIHPYSGGNGYVRTLSVFDDGTGPALFAGGWFVGAGNTLAYSTAKWDGDAWSALISHEGNATFFGIGGEISSSCIFDDGNGPALYFGGRIGYTGGPIQDVVKWDGVAWFPLGSGIEGQLSEVRALTVFDDGSGAALYAGGTFSLAGGLPAENVAKWDGKHWSAVGEGIGGQIKDVNALAVFDNGSGSRLFLGARDASFRERGVVQPRELEWIGLDGASL